MNDKQYIKCFYNEKTNATYKTLKEAKEACKYPNVYRCWMLDGEIKVICPLFTGGSSSHTIKQADETIFTALKNGTVGKGKIDKRYVD